MKTYNFKLEEPTEKNPAAIEGEFIDHRNGIVCVNPTCDLQCYLNYIELLNGVRDNWKNVGYLDLGMVPILMAPSFMHANLVESVLKLVNAYNLKVHLLPAVSLLQDRCNIQVMDIWAFKKDVAKIAGYKDEREVSSTKLIRWAMKNIIK